MDPETLILIGVLVLVVLSLGGAGYGYYGAPAGGGPSPLISALGVLGLILLVAFIVMLATGWRFGMEIAPPP